MSSKAMDRNFVARYRKIVAMQKLLFSEQFNSRVILESRNSTFPIRQISIHYKDNDRLNITSNKSGLLVPSLLSNNSSKGNQIEAKQIK